MYNIDYDLTNALKKDKYKLLKNNNKANKIKIFLEKLSKNPFSNFLDIKKLQPKSNNKFRLKVNEYRVIYSIDFGNNIILIHRIGLRKDIYK